ncbi:hypothetical protein G6F37_009020 [Rhizopus arrhizus]|nr:hypothetical protein G6F38_009073 [Rhizopus arrhizus]KAG1154910.1 hypothetical protein G6F37_009020 [Rhizopus arrhizus]
MSTLQEQESSTPNESTSLLLPYHHKQTNYQGSTTHPTGQIYHYMKNSTLFQLLPTLAIGCSIWFGMTASDELTLTSIRLLAVFISCIFALLTTSLNISVLVLTSLTFLSLTQSFQCQDHITGQSTECRLCGEINPETGSLYDCRGGPDAFQSALIGFSSPVVWLIFAAFHLGKAVEVTGLGKRMSLWMIQSFGKHITGLAYSIVFSELILAPFVPSNTARGGGIVLPVVRSIATSLGSTPTSHPQIGGYLMLVGAHANLLSASMYLTGMASNPIVLQKASTLFPDLHFGFVTWITGSIVPTLICALLLPFILSRACGLHKQDEKKNTQGDEVIEHAREQLNEMGTMSLKESQLCLVLFLCLILWATSAYTSIDSTLVALLGIVTLLYMETIQWKDVAQNTNAWETFFWLAGFITIATQLSQAGASAYLGNQISLMIQHLHLPATPALSIAYFLTTFLFSSLSAHTVAFVGTFLDAGHALGVSPMILTCLLAYFSSLGGCMTNFSTGSSAMYFSPGYVSRSQWFLIGAQLALFYILVYFTIGLGWWHFLGWQ